MYILFRCFWGALVALLILLMVRPAAAGQSLTLAPETSLLLVFDQSRVLASADNKLIFEKSGYRVQLVTDCGGREEGVCLEREIRAVRRRAPNLSLLLLTTRQHSGAVLALYRRPQLGSLLSGVVLFRAELEKNFSFDETFPDFPQGLTSAPPLLVLAREEDPPPLLQQSQRFADELRRAGISTLFLRLPSVSLRPLAYPPVVMMLDFFIGARRLDQGIRRSLMGRAQWQTPPFDLNGFYQHPRFLSTHPVDDTLRTALEGYLELEPKTLAQWPLKTYIEFDVLAYQAALADGPAKRYLVLNNHVGQQAVLDLEQYKPYSPRLVVGLDHERNLFRINWFYKTKRAYSWKPSEKPLKIAVKPLGAFLIFDKALPPELVLPFSVRSKLSFESFSFQDKDPWAAARTADPLVLKTITQTNHCLNCHQLDGMGGRNHHIEAESGKPQGGYALPLRSYPRAVLQRFFFHQDEVAALIGVSPNHVPRAQANALFELLTETP